MTSTEGRGLGTPSFTVPRIMRLAIYHMKELFSTIMIIYEDLDARVRALPLTVI